MGNHTNPAIRNETLTLMDGSDSLIKTKLMTKTTTLQGTDICPGKKVLLSPGFFPFPVWWDMLVPFPGGVSCLSPCDMKPTFWMQRKQNMSVMKNRGVFKH